MVLSTRFLSLLEMKNIKTLAMMSRIVIGVEVKFIFVGLVGYVSLVGLRSSKVMWFSRLMSFEGYLGLSILYIEMFIV